MNEVYSHEKSAAARVRDWRDNLNPNSLVTLTGCKLEPSLASASAGDRYQFERQGYFCADVKDSAPGSLVFNRIVGLRDTWARTQQQATKKK